MLRSINAPRGRCSFPLPAKRGEGAERASAREAGEGLSPRSHVLRISSPAVARRRRREGARAREPRRPVPHAQPRLRGHARCGAARRSNTVDQGKRCGRCRRDRGVGICVARQGEPSVKAAGKAAFRAGSARQRATPVRSPRPPQWRDVNLIRFRSVGRRSRGVGRAAGRPCPWYQCSLCIDTDHAAASASGNNSGALAFADGTRPRLIDCKSEPRGSRSEQAH